MSNSPFDVDLIEDHLEDYFSIAGESLLCFGTRAWQTYVNRVGRENLRGVYRGNKLCGGLAFYRTGQWFGGRVLPCAGFSGVAISPSFRGSGACAKLLRETLTELRSEGFPLASLYASTQHLYRSVGFEHAGTQTQYSIPIQSIRASDRSLEAHRFESPPIDKLNHVADRRAQNSNGHFQRTDGLWQRLLDPYDGRGSITYLIGNEDAPDGFAIFRPGTRDAGVPQALQSTDVAANTPAALQRLLTLIRDHRSMCDTFEWYGAANDPLHFLADEQFLQIKHFMRWMLRIVSVEKALEQRGYPKDVQAQLHFEIEDPILNENTGRWLLNINQGTASVEPGGEGHLRINIQALAPLFSSFYSAEELVTCGAIESSNNDQIQLATRVFSGPAPWLPEIF